MTGSRAGRERERNIDEPATHQYYRRTICSEGFGVGDCSDFHDIAKPMVPYEFCRTSTRKFGPRECCLTAQGQDMTPIRLPIMGEMPIIIGRNVDAQA